MAINMRRINVVRSHLSSGTSFTFEKVGTLTGKTLVISGASRGIGLAIGLRAAQDGANVAILAKTTQQQASLEGTIFTAAEEIKKAGGKALPIKCDIRFEDQIQSAVDKVVSTFGGIDILINNASAISLTPTLETNMKRYDLMHSINTRGTFLLSKICLPHLLKAGNPHILNLSPPLNMEPRWFENHVAYTMAKYGMSMCVLGMAEEFRGQVGVNALWPRTAIATAAVKNLLGGDESMKRSRKIEIMGDSAYVILTSNCKKTSGNFFIDEEVLSGTDLSKYKNDQSVPDDQLMPDLFV